MAERDLLVRIIGDEKDLIRALHNSARGTKQFEAQMGRTSRSVRNVFAAAGIGLGAAGIIRALRSTVGAALSFESSFAGVRKTVDATEPQLQSLAASFRRLALEIPVSVDELNRIGEAAGQLGIQRKGILDFTKTIAALGATTNLATDEAANALARLANIAEIPQENFDNLGSTIADLGNRLAATESEITEFGLRIAAAGKIVGLTVDQTLSIAGAFSSVNVEAEAGGTAVSKVFISLANAVQTGGKQLETFAKTAGVSAAEFRRAFEQDAGSAFVSFVQGLARIDKEGGNVFQTLKDLGLSDARLIRAFLSISQSGDLLNRSLAVGSRAWKENSALTEEARKRYETTASQLQIFQNRVNDLQITLGRVLAPALLEIVTPLGEWLEQTENQERVQRALIATMKDARAIFDGVRAVIQPLAEATKSLADRMGGLNRAVELLLVAMVVSKVVGFGAALTGLGTVAAGTTTRVNALRLALLRLGALAGITVAVEVILNRKAIHEKVTDFLDDLDRQTLGRIPGVEIEIPVAPAVTVPELEALRAKMADLKGASDVQVGVLDKIIARLKVVDNQNLRNIQANVVKLRKSLDGVKEVQVSVVQKGIDRILKQLAGIKNKTVEMEVREKGLKDLQVRLASVRSKTVDVAFVERGLDLIQAKLDRLSGRTIEIAVTTTELQRRVDARRGGGVEAAGKAIDAEITKINDLAKRSKARAARAFQNLMDSLSRDLTTAGATVSESDNLRVLQQQLAAVRAQIRIQGRTKDLLDQQAEISAQIVVTQRGIAESARSAAAEARVTAAAEKQAAEARMRAALQTALANKKADQFEQLGLTREGGQRVPGVGALSGRLATLREQVKGTFLDTKKTQAEFARIAAVLVQGPKKVGRDVRAAILQMLQDIFGALDQGGRQGPLTKTSGLNTKKILEGLGLSEQQIRELRGRLSSFNTAGRAPAGSQNLPTGGGVTGGLVVENYITVEVGGQKLTGIVTKEEQKRKRRNPKQKRGPNRNR